MVRAILRGVGFSKVLMAENGVQAEDVLKDGKVELIICDWNMPAMSGLEFLEVVRRYSRTMPFVMLTAEASRENVAAAIQAGVTDYLIKPFTAENLLEKVSSAVNKIKR